MKLRDPFDDWRTEDEANRIFRKQDYEAPATPANGLVERYVPQPDGTLHVIIERELIAVLVPAGE